MSAVNWEEDFTEILEDLRTIAHRCSKRDAAALDVLIDELCGFKTIIDDVERLRSSLEDIDVFLARCQVSSLDGENVELVLSIHALAAVSRFLRYRAPSKVVDLLKAGLSQVFEGASPPMFRGRKDSGRPSEVSLIHQVKGVLAGLTQVKQKSGMQRATAATWVARNIAPELASRLSVKQITSRAVLEWLDRYGGKHPPDDPGGKAFKVWSTPSPKPLTVQQFKEITARIAELIPARP